MPAKIKVDPTNWGNVTDIQVKTSSNTWGYAKSAWVKTDATTWVRWFLGPISDNFNRSVSGSLGNATTGEAWTNVTGTWFANGSAAQSDTAASSNAIATVAYGVNDVTVGAGVTNGTGVAAWVVDANNWYALVSFQTQVNTTYSCNCACFGHCVSGSYPVYNSGPSCTYCGSTTSGGGTSTYQGTYVAGTTTVTDVGAATCTTSPSGWKYVGSAYIVSRRCSSAQVSDPSNFNCYSTSDCYSGGALTACEYACDVGEVGHPGAYSCYIPTGGTTTCSCPQGGAENGGRCYTSTVTSGSWTCPNGGSANQSTGICTVTTTGTVTCNTCRNPEYGVAYYQPYTDCFSGGTYPNCDQYGGGCQTCGTLSNNYYIKIIRSVNGTITNLTGDISVGSLVGALRLNTQGDVLSYQAYSNSDFTGLLTSGTYTATSPAKANNYGIIKTSSPYGQGSTVDNFKVSGQDYNMTDPFERPARPWDLFNKNLGRVETEMAEQRFNICLECPQLIKLTNQCKECGCLMNLKTKLPNASCPLGKWGVVQVSYKETE